MPEKWWGGTGDWDLNLIVIKRPRKLWLSTLILIAAIAVLALVLTFSLGLIAIPGVG